VRGHTFVAKRFRLSAKDQYGAYHCLPYVELSRAWGKAKEFLKARGQLVALYDRDNGKRIEFKPVSSIRNCLEELRKNGYEVV
jgi:hypothetical protein